ncbi:MAG: phage integrase N-terminal SAM-like domain-containing protein [Pirellulales bacterium]|nr:phage integrase N-terminal SAM-like domain-containing protein [Pirellulales bacterium]
MSCECVIARRGGGTYYLHRVRQVIPFHSQRHLRDLGSAEIEQFLAYLAVEGQVSPRKQNQSLNALVFLYEQVLEIDLGPVQG